MVLYISLMTIKYQIPNTKELPYFVKKVSAIIFFKLLHNHFQLFILTVYFMIFVVKRVAIGLMLLVNLL